MTALIAKHARAIGTLSGSGRGSFEGRLSFPVNPGNITVKSSAGGSASSSVNTK